jgi:type IV secretory pathway TrbD component
VSQVCRAFTRPKLIHGVEWRMFYLILLGCMMAGFLALWNPMRLLLIPIVYFGPYTFFRWAGKHDGQWSAVYPRALYNRRIFLAGCNPRDPQAQPSFQDRRVIFPIPKVNA